jgi:hypothetical protein
MKTLFFNIPASGHINPTLPVIRELVRRGEQVVCVNMDDMRAQYEATGAAFIAYPDMPHLKDLLTQTQGFSIGRNALALTGISDQLLPWVFDLLTREQPDYVIVDSLCVWARQAAEKLGIRQAGSISTFVIAAGSVPPLKPGEIMHLIGQFAPFLWSYQGLARRMKRRHGVRPVGLVGTMMGEGAFNVVYTSRLFQPGSDKLPDARYAFVGPSIAERVGDASFPFDQLAPGQPVVYISLGTINNQNTDFYRASFEAFRDIPAQFILSVGRRTDIAALGDIPGNFIVRNFVPQLEVLQLCDLFITHGGMNSVHEGLWYGVPLVIIPQQAEQALVAMQVARHEAGIFIRETARLGQVSAADLRASVEGIFAERARYQAGAARVRESFQAAGGYVRAAEALMAFGRGG